MPKPKRHRNDLGSVFATTVVVVLGTGLCLAMYTIGTSQASLWVQVGIIASSAIFLCLLMGIRLPRFSSGLQIWYSVARAKADENKVIDYVPQSATPQDHSRFGQRRPITAEEVREIRLTSGSTWVPTRSRKRSSSDDEVSLD